MYRGPTDSSPLVAPETPRTVIVPVPTSGRQRQVRRRMEQRDELRHAMEALIEPQPQPTQTHSSLVHAPTAPTSLPTPSSSPFHPLPDSSQEAEGEGSRTTPPRPAHPRKAQTTPETMRSLKEAHYKLVKEGRGAMLSEEDKALVIRWSLGLLGEVTKKPGE